MDSQASVCKDLYENNNCYNKPDRKDVVQPLMVGHKEISIHEDTKYPSDAAESPPTFLNNLPNVSCCDSGIVCQAHYCCSHCGTPEILFANVFRTFAPAPDPDDVLPTCKKYFDEFRSNASQLLTLESSFKHLVDLGDDSKYIESVSDIDILNLVYKNILEVIVIQQSEDILAHLSKMEVYSDGAKTPPVQKKSADEESCPGAPMKTKRPPRKIDKDICRKIEF